MQFAKYSKKEKYRYKFLNSLINNKYDELYKYFNKYLNHFDNSNIKQYINNISHTIQKGGAELSVDDKRELENKIKQLLLTIYDSNTVERIFKEYNNTKGNKNPDSELKNLTIDEFISKLIDSVYNDPVIVNEIKVGLEKEINAKKLVEETKSKDIKLEETRLLNIENRKKSLEFFSNIIKKLSYTEEDIKLKNIIIPLLEEYYDLKTDFLFLEQNIYTKLYIIFDSYYLIPSKKGKITKITKEEDKIIRNIFLLKVN
jgi:hypothetical protein